jgi:hypothetical protein
MRRKVEYLVLGNQILGSRHSLPTRRLQTLTLRVSAKMTTMEKVSRESRLSLLLGMVSDVSVSDVIRNKGEMVECVIFTLRGLRCSAEGLFVFRT